eukprot:15435617-Alexandrium_andersonii.AAC.2
MRVGGWLAGWLAGAMGPTSQARIHIQKSRVAPQGGLGPRKTIGQAPVRRPSLPQAPRNQQQMC